MKVGIAKNGNQVSQHFGHCEGFQVFEVDEGKIVREEFLPSPGHRPGFLPPFLADHGINVIIAGGMGASAQELFKERGIAVIVGAAGEIKHVIEEYLKGNLVSSGSICSEHAHAGHCHD